MMEPNNKKSIKLAEIIGGGDKLREMYIPIGNLFVGITKKKAREIALGKLLELERKFNAASAEKKFKSENKRIAYLAYYVYQYVFEEKDEPEVILPKDFEDKIQ